MSRILTLDAIEIVLRVAAKSTGATEQPPNTNKGPYVERVLKSVGLDPGNPWCAADVYDTGAIALAGLWPLPKTGGCQALADFALHKGILFNKPERGDVFLVWHPELGRFAHTGFVLKVNADGSCETHEGNTSGGGSREGWMAAERTRTFGPKDRFARWVTLLLSLHA